MKNIRVGFALAGLMEIKLIDQSAHHVPLAIFALKALVMVIPLPVQLVSCSTYLYFCSVFVLEDA